MGWRKLKWEGFEKIDGASLIKSRLFNCFKNLTSIHVSDAAYNLHRQNSMNEHN